MIPDDTRETTPSVLEQSAGLEARLPGGRGFIVPHAAVPTAADSFHPLVVHEQSGSSKPRSFKAKLYQQIEEILGKTHSRKIICTCGTGIINAKKHVLPCTQSTLDYRWSIQDFRHQKIDTTHEEASGLSWRKYQLFKNLDWKNHPHSQAQGQAPYPSRCSPVLKIAEPEEGSSTSPSKIVTPSEIDPLIPGRTPHSNSARELIDLHFFSPQPPASSSVPLGKRSLVSQTFSDSTILPVVPQLNFAADYPTGSVEAESSTLISKPQAIILAFSISILLGLIVVVFCYLRRKKLARGKQYILNRPRLMRETSHRVTIEPLPPPKRSRNTESNSRSDRSLPAHCQFLHSTGTLIGSELRLGEINPPIDMLHGEDEMDQQHPYQNDAIDTPLRSRAVSLTASFSTPAASPTCTSAGAVSFPNCAEAAPRGNLSFPRDCSLNASGKSISSLNGNLQPIDLSCFEREMEYESGDIQSSSTSMKDRSATTASSMRRRSYIVADRISSLLRPSMSSGFSDFSSKPLPLRRLKASHGVGDDFDSDEEQDQAALSRFLRMQYAEWQVEQLSRADGGLETENNSSVAFRSTEKPRRRSTVFSSMEPVSLRSMKRGSFASMRPLKGPKSRPHSHFSYHPPSPYDFTLSSISPVSNHAVMYEPDQPMLANGTAAHPNHHFKGKSRFTSVLSAQDAQFCSSPKSLSSCSNINIPPPADLMYGQTWEDPKELGQQQVTPTGYRKKHRHSQSDPMNSFRESSTDLEPIEEIKLSITNPDVESNKPETQKKPLDSILDRELSESTRTLSRHSQDNNIHSIQPIGSSGIYESSTSGGVRSPEDEESNLETLHTDKVEVTEQYSVNATHKADDGETPFGSPKQPKRRSWLSSSLSLRILPGSPSKKTIALNMSPARLRKSLSIGSRISAREMKAGLHPLDLETLSSNDHDSHSSCRGYPNTPTSPSIKESTNHHHPHEPQPSPKRAVLCKSSSSSLTTLFGLFSKSKRSSNLLHQEFLGIASSPSPTSEFMSSSSSSYSGNLSLSLCDLSRLNSPQGTRSSTTTAMHSPILDGSNLSHTNPYSSATYSCDHIDYLGSTCGRADHDTTQIRWKSRLNSVGSFIEELETTNQTPQPGLVIANPDMTYSNEIGSKK